ncbi:3-hydroxyacyl-ACP dehydratase FabZ family protein [Kitasatospora sp. NPDC101183]|uniref:3-hydroxyacyl-ACP dehydratase FabZ family protein n=1 Tax=Kitasatospora sp. NPDC101183 TaxID=3364100 RepID=UPI0038106FC1
MTTVPVAHRPVSPVAGPIEVVSPLADGRSGVRIVITPDEPVFAGHYPDFPIFPGVCILECAHQGALATAPEPVALTGVDSARFSGAVYPGDTLTIDLVWRRTEDGWQCRAAAATGNGPAASLRLRFATADGGAR